MLAEALDSVADLNYLNEAKETLEIIKELGMLDADQAAYLFDIYTNNPFRSNDPLD